MQSHVPDKFSFIETTNHIKQFVEQRTTNEKILITHLRFYTPLISIYVCFIKFDSQKKNRFYQIFGIVSFVFITFYKMMSHFS